MKNGKYNIIYADPPWKYDNVRTGGSMKSGAAQKYPVMSVEDICNLPVKDILDKDSVLFLWVTVPFLPDGFKVMDAWGFKYKTTLFWRKTGSLGLGYWFRGQVECLLFGVRGKVKAFRLQEQNFFQCKRLKHSKKPEEFRRLVDDATAKTMEHRRKIELFATKETVGWDAVGYDVDNCSVEERLNQIILGN